MLLSILRLLARLPLSWLHAAGAALGWMVYVLSPTYARRLTDNLYSSGLCAGPDAFRKLRNQVIAETGKGVTELIAVWFGTDQKVSRMIRCDTWGVAEQAQRSGCGVIFLTPHLGCFEIAGLFGAQKMPITVMYRRPKLGWIEPLMIAGRSRWKSSVVPANARGVRMLYKALARGEAVGLLPDQAPGADGGVWADFFGRPAYTMTLVARLQKASGAAIIMACAERLPHGRGYQVLIEPGPSANLDEAALNRAVEALVRRYPAQYLWSYNRYKIPAGARAPTMNTER